MQKCKSSDLNQLEKNLQDMLAMLIVESDDLWKCLKYPTKDALSQSITTQDKIDLSNQDSISARFKLRRYNEDIVDEEICEVRMSVSFWRGFGKYTHEVSFLFEVVCHNNIVLMNDGRNRVLTIQKEILNVLNYARFDNLIGEITSERANGTFTSFNPKFQGVFFTLDTFTS